MRLSALVAVLAAYSAATPAVANPTADRIMAVAEAASFSGDLVYEGEQGVGYFGGQSLTQPKNPDDAKLWRFASVTKQMIAVLVLQEVGKGRIDLDAPVSRYLPRFKSPNAGKITVRQLLRHQSGLPNPDDAQASSIPMSAYYSSSYRGNRDPLAGYCAGAVKDEPGGNWAYNNCDYIVAGALLKAVTGQSWQALVKQRIARPFKLASLGTYPTKRWTRSGSINGKPEPSFVLAHFDAAGAVYGSIFDLMGFDMALVKGKLLKPAQLKELWDGQPQLGFIALGQWVFDASLKDCAKPVKVVERRGSIGGVQVRNFIFPERQEALAIFTDKSESDFDFGEIWQGKGFSHDILNAALCGATK